MCYRAGKWRPAMRFWFDTEFIEDGKTIDLISIGIVAQDGREYYAESVECDLSKASLWIRENVIPHLMQKPKTRAQIGFEIIEFVGDKPEFWAYYADYDWVALCQLYGTMMQLPRSWPMYCRDIKQLCDSLGNPKLPKDPYKAHHALADAMWNKEVWEILAGGPMPSGGLLEAYR